MNFFSFLVLKFKKQTFVCRDNEATTHLNTNKKRSFYVRKT